MTIVNGGVSHRTAPAEVLEKLAVPAAELGGLLARLQAVPGLDEVAVLSTCNRVEVYAAASGPVGQGTRAVADLVAGRGRGGAGRGPPRARSRGGGGGGGGAGGGWPAGARRGPRGGRGGGGAGPGGQAPGPPRSPTPTSWSPPPGPPYPSCAPASCGRPGKRPTAGRCSSSTW